MCFASFAFGRSFLDESGRPSGVRTAFPAFAGEASNGASAWTGGRSVVRRARAVLAERVAAGVPACFLYRAPLSGRRCHTERVKA